MQPGGLLLKREQMVAGSAPDDGIATKVAKNIGKAGLTLPLSNGSTVADMGGGIDASLSLGAPERRRSSRDPWYWQQHHFLTAVDYPAGKEHSSTSPSVKIQQKYYFEDAIGTAYG